MKRIAKRILSFLCALCLLTACMGEALPDALTFMAEAITTAERTVTASDGNTYQITVTYDKDSGIPENAVLSAVELTEETDARYGDYVAESAAALGEQPENLSFVKAFDISLCDPLTGEEYRPSGSVRVSVLLLDPAFRAEEGVSVVHLGEEPEVLDSAVREEAVVFETESFSVYVLAGVYTCTYLFYAPIDNVTVTETPTETGFTVSNWAGEYQQLSVKTGSGENVFSQTVKSGETPLVPQLADRPDQVFAGWFEGSYSGTDVSFGKTAYDFDNAEITENKTVNLYARYSSFARVVFHDQYNSELGDYPIAYVRRGELTGGSASVRIDDVSATYSGAGNYAFYGWSETPVQTPGNTAELVAGNEITVTADKDLYPVFQPFRWLSFYSAYTGSGATYVPQILCFDGDGPTELAVPEWEGRTFLGWFNGDLTVTDNGDGTTTDTVTYSTQITDANGAPIPGVEGAGIRLYGGKLLLSADTTLYAKWDDAAEVGYKVVVWKQKTTDAGQYDFAQSAQKTAAVGSTVSVDDAYKTLSYPGFAYSRCDDPVTVNPSGYTVLNVYYDREPGDYVPSGLAHTLRFQDSVTGTGASASLPAAAAVAYETPLLTGNSGGSYVPADPVSGREGFSFSGWYADALCSTRVFFDENSYNKYAYGKALYTVMPDEDLTIYAGWSAEWYLVQIDPNYGTFNGSGGTWFWETVDGDLVKEYTQVTRDYIPSSSGTYYYEKHDRAYYGYTGVEWDKSEKDRDALYTTDPGRATEDTTFESAPGVYAYAGWYEVRDDGTETPYDFTRHVDHHLTLKLHWKKTGVYYVHYDAGIGTLSGEQDTNAYADQAGVLVACAAAAPANWTFEGWVVRGDDSGTIYRLGDTLILDAAHSVTTGGKDTVYLEAVYSQLPMAGIVYDPNGGAVAASADAVDFGAPVDSGAPAPTKSLSDGKATVGGLLNNSAFRLSDGTGFSNGDLTLAGWSPTETYKPGGVLYAPGGECGVDGEEPAVLYAIWQATATYHLNTESASASWGGDWSGYDYNAAENTYSKTVYLDNALTEPADFPTDAGKLFRGWTETASDPDPALFDFSAEITGNVELYAWWSDPIPVAVHAVDASAQTLAEKTDADGWTITGLTVGTAPIELTASSHVEIPSGSDYVYAFAAVSADIDSVSEDDAVTNVFYNTAEKQVYVTDRNGAASPLDGREIYFVYYRERALTVGYRSMDAASVLSEAAVDALAPNSTGTTLLGESDMKDLVAQPLGWASDSALTYYSFAVGKADAGNAGELYALTAASDSDGSRPTLRIRNTWRGFRYSVDDGASWVSCGYEPALYVVYFTRQPTVVTVLEETLGTAAVMDTEFEFTFVITQTVTESGSDPVTTVLFDNTAEPYLLSDEEAQSAILFYDNDGTTETTQTITVTQAAKTGFSASVEAEIGTVTQEQRKWTYTTGAVEEDPTAVFTNTQSDQTVTVHVARIDTNTNTIVLDDDMRSASFSFPILPGESKSLTGTLPAETVFSGDSTIYAFGTVLYGTDDAGVVTPVSMEAASAAFSKASGDAYALKVLDADGAELGKLGGGFNVYYLYYPMPQVRYVREGAGGALTEIQGALDGSPEIMTHNEAGITLNGAEVTQGQRFAIPMTGFRITQDMGSLTFRMPPILDDGLHVRYLSYTKLGAGNASDFDNVSSLGENVSEAKTMQLRVQDNALQWSFDGSVWTSFTGTPTIYAIYGERGYDLQITKSVPIDVGSAPSFTVTLRSAAITQSSYRIEGYSENQISATPADGSTLGEIVLTVTDGTSVRLKGLGQGSYTVTETGNENYVLTARCGAMNGALEETEVLESSLTFSLNREKRLELINTHKAICKIVVGGTEIPFYTLQSAFEYVKDEIVTTAPVEVLMLTDYVMPASDQPVVPAGYTIKLGTAKTDEGVYCFDGGLSGTASGAAVIRAADFTSGPMITNRGTLTLDNLTMDGNNVAADSAMLLSMGALNVTNGAHLKNADNTTPKTGNDQAGNGGAIHAASGTVTVSDATISECSAVNGGAIYSRGSEITVTGTVTGADTLSGNSATNGGAIYYNGTGTISITGAASVTENTAANGGAIYAETGTIAVSGGSMTKNSAVSSGGAIYTVNGAVNVSGGVIGGSGAANTAVNGAAIFVDTGTASFSGGSVTGNTASGGGAVGVGSASARLYFSGSAVITGNTLNGTGAANVYLNQDTDAVINAAGLDAGAAIGVCVADAQSSTRGVPGAKFGVYSAEGGIEAFHNDRLPEVTVTADTDTRRLVWGKALQLQVRYMEKYSSAFPKKSGGSWNGTQKYPGSDWEVSYFLPANDNAASAIADDLRAKYTLNLTATAAFACAFLDDGETAIGYENYVTRVHWVSGADSWLFTKRDGSTVTGDKLVVYFSEPAYLNIENNTEDTLNISALTVLGYPAVNTDTQTGYGYVFAANGTVQDSLRPITAGDLVLSAGKSVKLLFPGGLGAAYTMEYSFPSGPATASGNLKNEKGGTQDIRFGGAKPICKIVTSGEISGVGSGEIAGKDETDEDGYAYLFSSLSQAVTFVGAHSLTSAVIELLVDYLIPGSDLVSIPAGLNVTFTTAIGTLDGDFNYSSSEGARATVSRDNGNTSSFIIVPNGSNTTSLTVKNLIFDGKNYAGNIDGGVIKTKNCAVRVENCKFQNCIAKNGGGMYIEFDAANTSFDAANAADLRGTLSVAGCNFTNCRSNGGSREGGGAIWTNARKFTVTGAKDASGYSSGVFDSCAAFDQGGAVFHRIDFSYPQYYRENSYSTFTDCKFYNCTAQAAGGLEIDSYHVAVTGCLFERCQGTKRNCGGLNLFIQTSADPHNADWETSAEITGCTFKGCTAATNGGGVRSLMYRTTITNCVFTDNTAGENGGAISITNTNAKAARIENCTITGCSAKNGGGVFFDGSKCSTGASLTVCGAPGAYTSSITGNTAANRGGGIYTFSNTTLINTEIRNNQTVSATVDNAAGVYITKTLTLGETGASEDTTVITGNTASGGVASNLHLLGGDKASSVVVNCDLSEGSHIGVTNPGNVAQQFGTSPNSTNSPFWRPYGLSDPTPDDPEYYPTFVSDVSSVYGIIDRSDGNGVKIIWAGAPICKITDAEGNLLYLDGAKKYPAIFDALEGGTAGAWTSAFSVLGVANPVLYSGNGAAYTTKAYTIEMLIETYELKNTATTYKVPNNGTPLEITLTTADASDASYPYRGTPGSTAVIVRKSGFVKSMFNLETRMTFTDIILDGGAAKGLSADANGGVLNITESRYAGAVLGTGAIIRNSTTTGNGTVYVDWGDFTLAGGTIQDCTAKDGGAVYMRSRRQTNPDRGFLRLDSGSILNCTATGNGGGVYVNTGEFTMTAVSIRGCTATGNGGGICFMADGQNPTMYFTMSGGTISGCEAASGGGVYVNNKKATFNMSGGFIIGNHAETSGGGIAAGGNDVKLSFSKTPWVSGNTCDGSVADGNACNVELNWDKNTVIQTDGIWNGARIGVYVPEADNGESATTSLYDKHGGEGDRFGTFGKLADASYLYGFVNDRNGLKGGLQSGTNPSAYQGIHWIKIFSLEIVKTVESWRGAADDNEEFAFKVTLTGTASDGTVAETINSTPSEPEKYGGLYFVNGIATQMVVNNGVTTELVPLKLKSGGSVTGERLPPGLNYTVEELLTAAQKKAFASTPDEKIYGYIGENAESTTKNRYLSTAEFTNLRPICKITRGDTGATLYCKTTVSYNWNEGGSSVVKQYVKYLPAAQLTLQEAFEIVNTGTTKLFFQGSSGNYLEYTDSNYRIEMLASTGMAQAASVSAGKTVTLTTAGTAAAELPYQGSGTTAVISRGDFNDASMLTANGHLLLTNISLDGAKDNRTGVTADGGVVYVPNGGALTVQAGANLRNSRTSGNGGAVYVAAGGTMTMTGGTINLNAVTGSGDGAGVYLAEGSSLRLSGNPNFGGLGMRPNGSLNTSTGNIKSGTTRQDIFIAGYAGDDGDLSAASLTVAGNISSGDGTIWVWAAESPHYKAEQQFAAVDAGAGITVSNATAAAFRNARDDEDTMNTTGDYLRGTIGSGDQTHVFWNGVSGSRAVILKKVSNTYVSVPNAVFTVYHQNAASVVKIDDTELKDLSALSSGVIWCGILPYGTYYLKETTVPSGFSRLSDGTNWFSLTVDKDGVVCSGPLSAKPAGAA